MGTLRVRTNLFLGSINTTKLLSISNTETLYTISSGNIALEATNLGNVIVYYGNSGVLANSGGLIFPKGSKFWDSVTGDFSLRFVSSSASSSSTIVIQEYAGN